ncbi:hypothetical protein EU99_1896 [Prochlorococcus marinus str. MIT 9321]|uniref:Uncharacterized protein n=1 Tax=Prochlorococcus marinus str. MIT 9401 TaxID=167551 RepID=A0A0A2B3A8_PROMR|nr:hypothetical protein [Prochlorococcus marinus]KGG02934.1 hypothetical protein EU99_1896 [Prochlorococcus marinus str. MIT 9321]KGG05560.1 hypothetical protein EV00_1194 [Prochlorococcus marinus str. MIT 9322]KGG07622.1 hypothetical protein EV01_1237 [Prochlorococcus marinus str. MIT 9401]
MAKVANGLDIYYAIGNANTQRQGNEIAAIMKKRNSVGWKLISTSTAILDIKNQFSNLYFGKRNSKQYFIYLIWLFKFFHQKIPNTLTSDK